MELLYNVKDKRTKYGMHLTFEANQKKRTKRHGITDKKKKQNLVYDSN